VPAIRRRASVGWLTIFFVMSDMFWTLYAFLCVFITLWAFMYSLSVAHYQRYSRLMMMIYIARMSTSMPFHPIVSCCWSFIAQSHCTWFFAPAHFLKNNCCLFFTWAEIFMIKFIKNIFIVIQFRDVSDLINCFSCASSSTHTRLLRVKVLFEMQIQIFFIIRLIEI
jgi:hypothetical protein